VLNILRRAGIEAVSASLDGQPIRGSRGTMLIPDTSLDEALKHDFDMVVLPGGQPGTNNLKADARIIQLVTTHGGRRPLWSVPSAPHLQCWQQRACSTASTPPVSRVRWMPSQGIAPTASSVEDGKLITSRGPGTAMDFALTLVERLAGKAKRDAVEAGLVR